MPRTRDEARVEQARALASQGKTVTEIAAVLGVDRRTVQRWGVASALAGRPRVSDEEASARTARRRRRNRQESPAPDASGDRPYHR